MAVSSEDVRKLFALRREALSLLLPHRAAIERAADGTDYLPEPAVLRALCKYVAGDFNIWIDGKLKE